MIFLPDFTSPHMYSDQQTEDPAGRSTDQILMMSDIWTEVMVSAC